MTTSTENKIEETKEITQANTTVVQPDASAQASSAETSEQINWKKFREGREKDRKETEAAKLEAKKKAEEASALKAALDAVLNKPNNTPEATQSPPEESDTDKIRREVENALSKREKERDQERFIEEQKNLPRKLNQAFSDFDTICSTENIDYLEYHYPEVTAPYKYAPDSFETWSAIYKAIKKFVPNPDSKKDQRAAEKNFKKPQSMAVGGVTSSGDLPPKMLDDKRKAENWQRMQKRMKGIA